MPLSPCELAVRYPRLYHMAEDGSWESIRTHGLRSTKALLDLFEVQGQAREALYSRHRPESVRISHPIHGSAVVRDQKPMGDSGLVRSLGDGLTPRGWYEILNDRVFFWVTEGRLTKLLGARAYRSRRHTVITVDTTALLSRHRERVSLSPINSGCTRPAPQPRGLTTFQRVSEYPFEQWVSKRGARGEPVVELAVDYSIPDIADLTVRVERRQGENVLETLWSPTE